MSNKIWLWTYHSSCPSNKWYPDFTSIYVRFLVVVVEHMFFLLPSFCKVFWKWYSNYCLSDNLQLRLSGGLPMYIEQGNFVLKVCNPTKNHTKNFHQKTKKNHAKSIPKSPDIFPNWMSIQKLGIFVIQWLHMPPSSFVNLRSHLVD